MFGVQCNSMITQATLVVFTLSEASLDQGNGQGLTVSVSHTISLLWSISRNIILHENDVLSWTATVIPVLGTNIKCELFLYQQKPLSLFQIN